MRKPDPETRTAAKDRITELKNTRDKTHANAEQLKTDADEWMWKAIAAELDDKTLLQLDVTEVTGFSRDHVLRRTKQYRKQKD